ncbi:hypothetical protein GCM10009603_34540 [Nocardiopsis exhalans]
MGTSTGRGWRFVSGAVFVVRGWRGVRGSDGFCSVRTVGAVWGHQRPHTAPNTPVPPKRGPDPGFGPTQGC